MRKLIYAVGTVAILAAAFVVVQPAKPNPMPVPAPAPMPQVTSPTITWSVSQLTQTMFPGTKSTVAVSFQSDQDLTGVALEITPSLDGIVSASPASFASITANQPYQITLTLSAPAAFIRRSFGGTIHLRNAGPPKTYAPPLAVELQTDFLSFTDPQFTIKVPANWVSMSGLSAQMLPDGALRGITFSLPTDPRPVLYIYVYPHGFADFSTYDEPPGLLGSNNQFDFYFQMRSAPADPALLAPLGLTDDQFHTDLLQALATFQTP
jgi:hypothetical protein